MSVKDSVLPSRAMAFWGLAAALLLAAGSPPVQAQDDALPVGTESFSIPNLGGWVRHEQRDCRDPGSGLWTHSCRGGLDHSFRGCNFPIQGQ